MAYDAIIIGAGLSGLALAQAMVAHDGDAHLLLLDASAKPKTDRVWCWWETARPPWTGPVDAEWPAWRVRAGAREVTVFREAAAYRMLRAETYHAHALKALASAAHVEVRRPVGVKSVCVQEHSVSVVTEDGQRFRAKLVFDSRPPGHRDGAWRQAFRGWEVRTERAIFEPSRADVMDFAPTATVPIRFFYVLPFSQTHALVEDTIFTDQTMGPPSVEPIHTYLSEHGAGQVECVREEAAVLPMDPELKAQTKPSRHVRIGLAGGASRPATGYAFTGCLRQGEDLARQWAARPGAPLSPRPLRPTWLTWMDRVFLRVLHNDPDRAPELFVHLFERGDALSVTRFLSDRGDLFDAAKVALSLPKAPFLKAAWQERVRL